MSGGDSPVGTPATSNHILRSPVPVSQLVAMVAILGTSTTKYFTSSGSREPAKHWPLRKVVAGTLVLARLRSSCQF